MSETNLIRDIAEEYIYEDMHGIDIGFGGDKINRTAIGFDLPTPYTSVGADEQDGFGDAEMMPYPAETFDYVYSSHLLEDYEDTEALLKEWMRILKVGGIMFLYLPIEEKYKAHCEATGQNYNLAHKANFTVESFAEIARSIGATIHTIQEHAIYSFYAVLFRTQDTQVNEVTALHSGDLGDIVYAVPIMKRLGVDKLFMNTFHPGKPKQLEITDVTFTKVLLDKIGIPTFIHNGEEITWNLDRYRNSNEDTYATHLTLAQARPLFIDVDLTPKYFDVEPHVEFAARRPIVVNRSTRYHGKAMNWDYLLHDFTDIIFVGFKDEYDVFYNQTGVKCDFYQVRNMLDMARLIKASSAFVGNQSLGFALAEALKVNRIQELCTWVPNVVPQSWNGIVVNHHVTQLQRARQWLTKWARHLLWQ